jgi:hypothetical protein
MGNTYGTWLRGDPRGWRERHHRRHIEGDYKHPPKKEDYEALNRQSHDLMKRNAVRLERRLRWIALVAIIGSLRSDQVEVLVVSLDDHHLHLIARFQKHNPRRLVGWAKFHATKTVKAYLKAHGAAVGLQLDLREGEGIWAKRSKAVPVRDRDHQVNVCGYSADHGKRGAAVFIHPSVEKALQKMGKLPEKKNPRRRRGLS